MNLAQRIQNLTNEFSALSNWEDRYKKIIEMGRALPDLPDSDRTEEAKVKGCQSQVWLHAELDRSGTEPVIIFRGDSDALLVKGLVAVLLKVYSGSTPSEILGSSPEFLKDLGFEGHLSPSRANGLFSMLKQIRNFALAFQLMLSTGR